MTPPIPLRSHDFVLVSLCDVNLHWNGKLRLDEKKIPAKMVCQLGAVTRARGENPISENGHAEPKKNAG